jgi:hypothetical protein
MQYPLELRESGRSAQADTRLHLPINNATPIQIANPEKGVRLAASGLVQSALFDLPYSMCPVQCALFNVPGLMCQ